MYITSELGRAVAVINGKGRANFEGSAPPKKKTTLGAIKIISGTIGRQIDSKREHYPKSAKLGEWGRCTQIDFYYQE